MVLSEARGLSLFLVIRGGITCVMGDSVPKHTRPISLTDTRLEPSVSRTRPTMTMNFGYLLSTAIFMACFIAALAVQIRAKKFIRFFIGL